MSGCGALRPDCALGLEKVLNRMSRDLETVQKDRNAAVALGGNLDLNGFSADQLILRALEKMMSGGASGGIRACRISRFFRTPAHPPGNGPDYVNAVAQISTELSAEALLDRLHAIEASFARERAARWASRTVDLDLLFHGDRIAPDPEIQRQWMDLPPDRQRIDTPDRLILPHPRLQDRPFVLIPLADILPDWVHPVTGQSVRQMVQRLPADEIAAICPL